MNPLILGLILFGSNKQLYIKADAVIGVYDVDCANPVTGELVKSNAPCAVVVTIGNEYMVTRVTADDLLKAIKTKKQ